MAASAQTIVETSFVMDAMERTSSDRFEEITSPVSSSTTYQALERIQGAPFSGNRSVERSQEGASAARSVAW
jgi:hypothetical protein